MHKSLERIEQTLNAIRDDSVPGRVMRLHVPPSLLQQIFMPMLSEFRRDHPEIRIDVSSANAAGLPIAELDIATFRSWLISRFGTFRKPTG